MSCLKGLGFLALVGLLTIGGGFAAAEIVIVVSPQNPTTALTKNEVSNIFLGKTNYFPGDGNAVPIDQPEGSQPRIAFYLDISNKQPADIKAHWSKMVFTGRGQPPMVVNGDAQVKRTLASQPEGIGYIDSTSVDERVKVLVIQ